MTGSRSRDGHGSSEVGTDDEGPLRAQFERADLAAHLALFYESADEQRAGATAFVKHGLGAGGRVLYIADHNDPEEVRSMLRAGGVDVGAREASGALSVVPASAAYLDAGFDPDRMLETLREEAAAAEDAGHGELFVAGENTWTFEVDVDFEEVLEFERRSEGTVSELECTAMCQYDLGRFDPSAVVDAIRTHSQVVYRGTLCENPYFVPPGEYLTGEVDGAVADRMLRQTLALTRASREASRREERLGVVDRVLRHNLRNDLNVALGQIEAAAERAGDGAAGPLADAAAAIEDVLAMANKARAFDAAVADERPRRIDVAAAARDAADRAAAAHPDATVEVDAPPSVEAFATDGLEFALDRLLEDALSRCLPRDGTVRLAVRPGDGSGVGVEVHVPGAPVPESERTALRRGQEAPLEHGTGIDLWLAKWVVETAGGRLRLPEPADGEPTVAVELPA